MRKERERLKYCAKCMKKGSLVEQRNVTERDKEEVKDEKGKDEFDYSGGEGNYEGDDAG